MKCKKSIFVATMLSIKHDDILASTNYCIPIGLSKLYKIMIWMNADGKYCHGHSLSESKSVHLTINNVISVYAYAITLLLQSRQYHLFVAFHCSQQVTSGKVLMI